VSSSNRVVPVVSCKWKSMSPGFWVAAVVLLFGAAAARAATISPNTGSLGSAANGTNADTVTTGPGALGAGDLSAVYTGVTGSTTTIPFQPGLNPTSNQPFTIEFWGRPTASDNDDSPVSNRVATAPNRSGWAFFQRAAASGWDFKMYNGNGSTVGVDLVGGTANLNEWSHVVVTWDGAAGLLYVNGALADNTNAPTLNGVYNANTSTANFIVASTDTASPFTGSVDEVALYNKALSPADVLAHYTAGTATPGAYQALVRTDGALLQLSNNAVPEPSALGLLAAGAMLLMRRRA